jgi:hypothetical protein
MVSVCTTAAACWLPVLLARSPDLAEAAMQEVTIHWAILLAVFPVLYVAAFVHELGHVLAGRLAGFRVNSFGMGVGRMLWAGSWGGTRVYFGLARPFQGITFAMARHLYPTRRQQVLDLAGGVLAQAALVLAALALWWCVPWGGHVWLLAAVVNGLGVLINLVPFNVRIGGFALRSDGALIAEVIRDGVAASPPLGRVLIVAGLRPLWTAAGDMHTLYLQTLAAATGWLELGNRDQAARLCEQAGAPSGDFTPLMCGIAPVVRGAVEREACRWEQAGAALDEAEQILTAAAEPHGDFLVGCARAELLVRKGETADALALIDKLLRHPLAVDRPALRRNLVLLRLATSAVLPDADLAALQAEVESAMKQHPAPATARALYHTLARVAVRRGDAERAEAFFRRALDAAATIAAACADREVRQHFLDGQAELLAEARTFFVERGRPEEAERLAGLFPSLEEQRRRNLAEIERRNRAWHRRGQVVALLNLVVAAAILLPAGRWDRAWVAWRTSGGLEMTAVILISGMPLAGGLALALVPLSLLALFYSFAASLLGRLVAAARRGGGPLTFWLALLPWLSWLAAVLAILLLRQR